MNILTKLSNYRAHSYILPKDFHMNRATVGLELCQSLASKSHDQACEGCVHVTGGCNWFPFFLFHCGLLHYTCTCTGGDVLYHFFYLAGLYYELCNNSMYRDMCFKEAHQLATATCKKTYITTVLSGAGAKGGKHSSKGDSKSAQHQSLRRTISDAG